MELAVSPSDTARWFVFVVILWTAALTGLLNGEFRVWSTPSESGVANEIPCAKPAARCFGWYAVWRGI